MQGSGTTDEATIVGGATRGGVARRMSTPVVIEIEYDGVPAGSHRSSTYGDNKRNSYGSSMYETTPLLASKRPVSLSLDALGGDFFAPEPAPSLALFTSAAAAREWAYAQWIEQRARIAQIGLIVAFAFFATLKPVLQKELYIAFSFDFPFLLATIENGFFAPIALVAYMLAPAWLRVPKAHHHHHTTAAVLATEAHRDGALQVVPIDATVLRSTERRRTTTTSSGEEMLELVDFEPDYRQYYTISSAPTSLAPPTTSGRSSIVVVAPEVLLATPDPTAPTPDIPLPPSPPPPSASPSATTDFASYVWLVLPVGLALAAQFIFATWATLEAPISLLAVTKAAQPVLTAVFGFVLFSKRTSWPVCVILVALGAGSSLDLVSVRLADHVTTLGAVLAVMSAIATVMRSLLAERAMSDYSSLTLMLLANPVSFALCLATFLASGELSGVLSYTWTVSVVLYVCMQAVFESILLLLALAVIEYTSAVSQAVTVAAVRPASTILGVVFFSEVLTLLSIVGMLITFGASFLYALAKWPAFTAWLSTYF